MERSEGMQDFKIYLGGSMCGSTFEEQTKWRRQVRDAILFGDYDYKKKVDFFDPTQFYNFEEKRYKSESEVMEFDLYNLRSSNLLVVNFNNPSSIGTAMEIMLAKELHIPVLGLNKDKKELHPWLECSCNRICDDMRELVTHVVEFYLN